MKYLVQTPWGFEIRYADKGTTGVPVHRQLGAGVGVSIAHELGGLNAEQARMLRKHGVVIA